MESHRGSLPEHSADPGPHARPLIEVLRACGLFYFMIFILVHATQDLAKP